MLRDSLIGRIGMKFFYLLVRKVPISQVVKDKLPHSIKFPVQRLISSFNMKSWSKISEFKDFEKMDEDFLATFIRHCAHILDKTIRTRWNENKVASYTEYKFKLIEALKTWQRKGLDRSDDILWAEQVVEKYIKWEQEKKPIEPTFVTEEKGGKYNIYDVIRHRRSIRYFENKDIEKEKIMNILEAGRWAPCSGNRQAWKFIVQKRVRGSCSAKSELNFEKERRRQGSVLIYVAIDERLYPEKYTAAMDAATAIQNMLLMAHSLGLGGCWLYLAEIVGNQNKLRKKLGLEDYYYVYSAILVGYAAESPDEPGRKPVDKIVSFIGFDSGGVEGDE